MHTKCQGVSRSNTILAWIIEWFTLGKDSFHTNAYTNQKSNNIKVQTVKNDNCRTSTMTSWGLQLTPIHVIWRNWHAQIASWHGFKGCFNHGFPATFLSTQVLYSEGLEYTTKHITYPSSSRDQRNVHLIYCILFCCCWLLRRPKGEPLAGSSVCLVCSSTDLCQDHIKMNMAFLGVLCPETRRLKSRGVMSTAAPKMTPQLALQQIF